MALTRRKMSSAADLKALGHPVRLELLELLLTRGPLTATQAGALLDQTPANVSWHLRRLADSGFVRSSQPGPGRQRPWKAVVEGFDAATAAGAGSALDEVRLERDARLMSRALRRSDTGSARVHRRVVELSESEAAELAAALEAMVSGFADRPSSPTAPRRRPMLMVTWMAEVTDEITG